MKREDKLKRLAELKEENTMRKLKRKVIGSRQFIEYVGKCCLRESAMTRHSDGKGRAEKGRCLYWGPNGVDGHGGRTVKGLCVFFCIV